MHNRHPKIITVTPVSASPSPPPPVDPESCMTAISVTPTARRNHVQTVLNESAKSHANATYRVTMALHEQPEPHADAHDSHASGTQLVTTIIDELPESQTDGKEPGTSSAASLRYVGVRVREIRQHLLSSLSLVCRG